MLWVEEIQCTLPEGYSIVERVSDTTELYNESGKRVEIVDDHGHPAIVLDILHNKEGRSFAKYLRLDK